MSRVQIINRYIHHGQAIVTANKRTNLHDLPLACALVEQESGGKNIFGCDAGGPFCHLPVTKARIKQLLAQSRNQGVGLPQLTDRGLVIAAERKGGAHVPLNQCLVGFEYLTTILERYGHGGIWHYNGAPAYQPLIMAKLRAWEERLR